MEEISEWVDGANGLQATAITEGTTYLGIAKMFERVDRGHAMAQAGSQNGHGDVDVLLKFVEEAKATWEASKVVSPSGISVLCSDARLQKR